MGKGKKIRTSRGDAAGPSAPLAQQMTQQLLAKPPTDAKSKRQREENDPTFVEGNLSKKILDEARKQQQELEDELSGEAASPKRAKKKVKNSSDAIFSQSDFPSLGDAEAGEDDAFSDQEGVDEPVIQISAEDEAALQKFMHTEPTAQRTLADLIQEKIDEKQTEVATRFSDVSVQMRSLDPRLIEMYRSVGEVLSSYRSGPLPKAFKIVPKMVCWEQILHLTRPDNWTAAAMYQATRIFVSNLNARLCQRFLNLVLLPRIRDDIAEFKKLNFHLYQALKKSLYKPAAFFKGILLPICESGTCTLREATIIGSVMTKCSIPMLHTAAALLKIAEMDYSGANSLFVRILIDKKYTLPYQAIDGLVHHFVRFSTDKRELPVLWHQALLSLVQRYKSDMSSEQRDGLFDLIKLHSHYQITPEIRRELEHTVPRDAEDGSTAPRMDID